MRGEEGEGWEESEEEEWGEEERLEVAVKVSEASEGKVQSERSREWEEVSWEPGWGGKVKGKEGRGRRREYKSLENLWVRVVVHDEVGWLGAGTQQRPVCGDSGRVSCCVGGGMQSIPTLEVRVGCSGPPRIVYCSVSMTCSMGTVESPSADCMGGCTSDRDRGLGNSLCRRRVRGERLASLHSPLRKKT